MDNLFRVLCDLSDENIRSNFRKMVVRLQEGENPRINKNKISFDYFSIDNNANLFDVVVIEIAEKITDAQAVRKLLNISEQFQHSQIVIICSLNLKDYKELSKSIKDTKAFSFGTELEAINRILNMQYLFEREQHLL